MKLRIFATSAAAIAAIAALAVGMPLSVPAQTIAPQAAQPAQPDDAEVRSFATAAKGVKRVADAYLPRLAEATAVEEQDRLEGEATSKIKEVVENEGMSVPRFNQILVLLRTDSDLAGRIRSHLDQTVVQ